MRIFQVDKGEGNSRMTESLTQKHKRSEKRKPSQEPEEKEAWCGVTWLEMRKKRALGNSLWKALNATPKRLPGSGGGNSEVFQWRNNEIR